MIIGMDEQVRKVGDEVTVGEGIAKADELVVVPSGDEGVGVEKAVAQLGGFVGG